MSHILVVDDEQSICWGLSELCKQIGLSVEIASTAEQGLVAARRRSPDAILLDVRLPGMSGLAAMRHFRDFSNAPIVVMTAYGDLQTAVEAVQHGAFEYLVKPFDLDLAERTIRRALAAHSPESPAAPASIGDTNRDSEERIVGKSAAIQAVFRQIALVAPTEACVHLWGESGTGKELVARAIHRHSRRGAGPFIPINMAALNPALAESELFGHVRGAFTGAEQSRQGLLEQASGGTVFFDEVADIPMALQVKLLRALEHGDLWPVGADRPVQSDFRVISATHQNLREHVADGRFRHDLYYRLITFQIALPALRERSEDMAELTQYFIDRLSAAGDRKASFGAEFVEELQRRHWHGNVRELRNAVEHAIILARSSRLTPELLPPPAPAPCGSGAAEEFNVDALVRLIRQWTMAEMATVPEADDLYNRLLALVEPPLFAAALERYRGQYSAAARRLGLHRTTLKKKLDDYGLIEE